VPQTLNSQGGYDDHTDGRLPNIKELASIVELACYDPALNATIFKTAPLSFVWSASPYADFSGSAWGVYFNDGSDYNDYRDYYGNYVRLVRSGQ